MIQITSFEVGGGIFKNKYNARNYLDWLQHEKKRFEREGYKAVIKSVKYGNSTGNSTGTRFALFADIKFKKMD